MSVADLVSIPVDRTGQSTRLARVALFVILVLFGGLMLWGSIATMRGAVVAPGVIKIDTNRKSVQHYEGGIIRKILVHEGDRVEQGQPLVLLEDTDRSAELNILEDTLAAHLIKEARLTAEASLAESVTFPATIETETSDKIRTLVRNELALFNAKRTALLDEIRLIQNEISHAEEAVRSLQARIAAGEQGLAIAREQLDAGQTMVDRGALDRNSFLEINRRYVAQDEALWEQKSDLAVRRQDVSNLRLQVVNAENQYRRAAEDELKVARQDVFAVEERLRPVRDALQRKTIRASIAGQVINLQASSVGGIVKPGETIAEIVPEVRDLVFEVRIKPTDADAVFVGQPVKIEVSAFNQRATPLVDAELTYVSGDALVDETNRTGSTFFMGHVRSQPEALSVLGDKVLTPGMPVVAYIQTSPRTFFDYLLSPLTSGMRRAMVEDTQ